MIEQAEDFRTETECLANLLDQWPDAVFEIETLFKGWRIGDVIGHLHMFNVAAEKSLISADAFVDFFKPLQAELMRGSTFLDMQRPWLGDLWGKALFETWRETAHHVADLYAAVDPKRRLCWAGPDMSALSSVTARQMETWAHGQEIFDALGAEREESDRIRNIAHLGVSTFGWTFVNRGLDVPDPAPHVRLRGPSGAIWTWNPPQDDNVVTGTAVDFSQIVTQVRNYKDTAIEAKGEVAQRWMAFAQCFAGSPEDPPVPGARHRVQGPPDFFINN